MVMMLGKNRDRVDIVAAVLQAVNSGASKTGIKVKANLSFGLLEKYLGVVVKAGLVRAEGCKYVLTESGQEFIGKYKQVNERYLRVEKLFEAVEYEREKLALMFENLGSRVGYVRMINDLE